MNPGERSRLRRWFAAGLTLLAIARITANAEAGPDKLTYHHDAQRSGWNREESALTPAGLSRSTFGEVWRSPAFDALPGRGPILFATPLYVDRVAVTAGDHAGQVLSLLYAVTDLGVVYAVNASAAPGVAAGTIIWRTRLVEGAPGMDTLSTPVIDLRDGRLYVVAAAKGGPHRVHALSLAGGVEAAGWPVAIDPAAVNAPGVNRNGLARFPAKPPIQRGALNLSPDGARLYVTFAQGESSGWIVGLDTRAAVVATAFSATARPEEAQGGMWASGGPTIDAEGHVHVATGSSVQVHLKKLGLPGIFAGSEHNWGQSVLRLRDDPREGFQLAGTYTPFNYAEAQVMDIDLGSSGTVAIDLDPATTATPRLLVVGGKQGNVYLLDRAQMPGSLVKRPAPADDASRDGSLLPPEIQPQFGTRGPLNVFGPYADRNAMNDQARSRTTPAYFRDAAGRHFVYVTGSAKTGPALETSTPPGLVRLEIVTAPGRPAYLRIDQRETTQVFENPGSPVVTSNGHADAIVWVLDTNVRRTAPLRGVEASRPVLYAFDASTFELLWKNEPGELAPTGKYNEPTIVGGKVFVGTERIQAFGLLDRAPGAAPRLPPLFSGDAVASATPPPEPAIVARGKALFEQRCALCHVPGQPGIPTRDALARMERSRVVTALATGIMKPQAAGLDEADVGALATYLGSLPKVPAARPREAPVVHVAGRSVYVRDCIGCHMPDGSGVPGLQPSLRESATVRGAPAALIGAVLAHPGGGGRGFGETLDDRAAADLVNYLREAFGGAGAEAEVAPADVARERS